MFSNRIVNSARFLKMSPSAQNLYFHLGMRADDDGIVEAFPILQMLGSAEDDFKVLVVKGFLKPLNEDLVTFILDWSEHNLIRADRKVNSIYKDLLLQIVPEAELLDPKPRADTGVLPRQLDTGRPVDANWTAQVKLGKVKVSKDKSIQLATHSVAVEEPLNEIIEAFRVVNPAIDRYFGNTTQRSSVRSLLKILGKEQLLKIIAFLPKSNGSPYAPTITTPYQLETKLAQLKSWKDRKLAERQTEDDSRPTITKI